MRTKTRVAGALIATCVGAGGMVLLAAPGASAQPVCVADGISRTIDAAGTPVYQNEAACGELYQYGPQPEVAPLPEVPPPGPVCDGAGAISHVVCGTPAPGQWIEEGGWLHYYPAEPVEEEVPEGTVTVGEIETVWVGDSGIDYGGGFVFGGGFFGGGFFGGSVTGSGTVTVGDLDDISETMAP